MAQRGGAVAAASAEGRASVGEAQRREGAAQPLSDVTQHNIVLHQKLRSFPPVDERPDTTSRIGTNTHFHRPEAGTASGRDERA